MHAPSVTYVHRCARGWVLEGTDTPGAYTHVMPAPWHVYEQQIGEVGFSLTSLTRRYGCFQALSEHVMALHSGE